jgi:predicted transporter
MYERQSYPIRFLRGLLTVFLVFGLMVGLPVGCAALLVNETAGPYFAVGVFILCVAALAHSYAGDY